jgi:RNA polymerase sigma factor (sigma-70 family)
LSRLRDWNDQPSWQDFFNTYWKLIYNTGRSAGLSEAEAEEVAQETLIYVSKSIRTFRYDAKEGSFKGWLRHTTAWRIRDRLRSEGRHQAESLHMGESWAEAAVLADAGEDPIARNWDLAWDRNLAEAALDRVKKRVAPKQFQIFDLAVVKQWPTQRIAKALRVNAGYVYLVKHRIAARLRSEVRKLRRDPCEVNGLGALPEVASLVRGAAGTLESHCF